VTVFYGVLDPAEGTLTYANAGHNPAFLLKAQTGTVQELGKTGIPIGIFEEVTWRRGTIQFQPGDTLVLYTDGASEARDIHRGEFGTARLLDTIQAHLGGAASELLEALVLALRKFMGAAPQFDDITLLVAVRTA
jgi:sigma-B regulation protein RsbU (phosphoserine phosphatase)